MDREKTINFAGSILIFFILLFVYSKLGPSLPISVSTQQRGEPFIVSGEGKVSVTPDIAKVTAGIQENGGSLKQVQDSVNRKSNTLTDALKKLGISESDIKTTSYNVYPQYDFTGSSQRIVGYQVSASYEVTVKDFDKVNEVIVATTANGANLIGGINFEVNDETEKEKLQEARDLAVKEAKEKAEGLAKSAGISLGKIINISENQSGQGIRQFALPANAGGEITKDMVAQPDIQPGETEINVTVSLSYEVR